MPKGSGRATAADVAELAGVSRSTVSYVLGGGEHRPFAPETITRVHAAAEQLGYTPHAQARALRRGRSDLTLLAKLDVPASWNLDKLETALADALRASGRSLVSWTTRSGNGLAQALRDISPQAILEILPLSADDRLAARLAGIPVLAVWGASRSMHADSGRMQVDHLHALGHRRLAAVTFSDERVQVFTAARLAGVRDAADRLGLPEPEVITIRGVGESAQSRLAEELGRVTARDDPATGVCAFNDLAGLMTVAAAQGAGIPVPERLSVVGVDDEPVAGFLVPGLTTVSYDFAAVAAAVVERLGVVDSADDVHLLDECRVRDSLRLVRRDSSAPPAGAAASGR